MINPNRWKVLAGLLLVGATSLGYGQAVELWSNPATWGGAVPVAGQDVTIPTGKIVLLDVSTPALGKLEVNGTLRFDRRDLTLTSKHVIVHHGLLEVGTEASPFVQKATIVLTGTNTLEDYLVHGDSTGTKGLVVHEGGQLELHGARRSATAWTKLDGTVNPGATQLTTLATTNWRVNDEICIAPSGWVATEAEKVRITAISGRTVTFTPALQYKHWGTTQTIQGKTVDERAPVGLLTRDIVIRGDSASDSIQFGGHTMIHHDAVARVEGVEFYKMGQMRKRARYPLHWHLTGDGTGQYAKNNSIHNSFHRGLVTHGVDNVLVEGNVAYDVFSHVYIPAEDGVEVNNIYRNNLSVLCRKLDPADFAFAARNAGGLEQSEWRPGNFWLRKKVNHKLEGNYAAGNTKGIGFFYDLGRSQSLLGGIVDFTNNTACSIDGHTSNVGGPSTYPPSSNGHGLFVADYFPHPTTPYLQVYGTFAAFKCRVSGTWTEDSSTVAVNHLLVDNGTGFLTMRGRLENSTVIGQSANTIGGPAVSFNSSGHPGGGVYIMRGEGREKAPKLSNVLFVDITGAAIMYHEKYINDGAYTEGLAFVNTVPVRFTYIAEPITGIIVDKDGTLAGNGQPNHILPNNSPLANGNSVAVPAWQGYYHRLIPSTEVIVDNTSAGAFQVGAWTASTSQSGFQGANYLHDGNTAKGTKSVSFSGSLPATDWYQVSVRYPASSNFASNTPVDIHYGTAGVGQFVTYPWAVDSVSLNQRLSGGTWVPLAIHRFLTGTTANNKVVVGTAGTDGFVIADAVKFTRMVRE